MKKSKIFRTAYIILLAAFLAVGTELAVRLLMAHDGMEFYRNIGAAGQAGVSDQESSGRSASGALPDDTDLSTGMRDAAGPGLLEAVPDSRNDLAGLRKYMELSEAAASLSLQYPDLTAWIQIPGTSIDYPVMMGSDNSFYLDHLPDGSRNPLGSLFFDSRCSMQGLHWIIYGHNGSGGRMLGELKNYTSASFCEAHGQVVLAVQDAVYLGAVFSVRQTQADSSAYAWNLESGGALDDYISRAASASLFQIDTAAYGSPKKVLTLSTCTGWGNQRLIVQALLYRKIQLPTSTAAD